MKLAAVVFAVLLLVAAVHSDDTSKVVEALKKCATDSGLSKESLQKACDGTLPDDLASYKCYTQCVQQLVGIMSADGTVDPEKAAASLVDPSQRPRMHEIAVKCPGDVASQNLCEKAYSVDQCYAQEDTDMYRRNCNELMKTVG